MDGIGGVFIPCGEMAVAECKRRNFKPGQKLLISFHNLRSYGTHKHAHNVGKICIKHIDDFSNYYDPHDVLKRLQIEGNIACDQIGATDANGTKVMYLIPRSLKYEDMDETEFLQVINKFYQFISKKYWPSIKPEAIQEMAELFGDEH